MAAAEQIAGGIRIVLLGAPGSGKGTQAEILARETCTPAISTGDMLRAAVAGGSELGRRVESILAAGALVDDATMAAVIRERLDQADARQGFVLDGYPRTRAQADTLAEILRAAGDELDAVVLIQVPEDELVRRALARQRADDTEEVIRRRLGVYRERTELLVGHYRRLGLLRRIDGHRSIEDVARAIRESLEVGV